MLTSRIDFKISLKFFGILRKLVLLNHLSVSRDDFYVYKRLRHFDPNSSIQTSLLCIQASLNFKSLISGRIRNDIYFMSKLVNDLKSCLEILQLLYFHDPRYLSRNFPTFSIPIHRTSHGCNSLMILFENVMS